MERNNLKKIEICFICGNNSELYVDFALKTLIKTSNHPERFEYLIGLNDKYRDINLIKNIFESTPYRIINVQNNFLEGVSHGTSLNELLNYVELDLFMIVDCDVAFLKKGWDDIMINLIDKDDCVMVGTSNHYSIGKLRHMSTPSVYVNLMKTDIMKKINMDFRPITSDKNINEPIYINIDTDEKSKIYGVKKGLTIFCDTGTKIPLILNKYGYKSVCITAKHWSEDNLKFLNNKELIQYQKEIKKKLKSKLIIKQNFHHIGKLTEFSYNDDVFFTHLGESRFRNFNENPLTKYWKKQIITYLLNKNINISI